MPSAASAPRPPAGFEETPTGSATRRCCPDSATSCLRIDDTSTTDNLAVVRPLTAPAGRFTVEYRVRLAQTNARMELGALLDSQHRRGVRVYFTNDGRIRIYEGGVNTQLQNYTANTWYKIEYVADTFTKRFDVYVDDVLKKRAMPFYDQAVTLSLLSLHTEDSTTGTAWIDDVKISEGGVLSLPTIQVLETFDGAPQGNLRGLEREQRGVRGHAAVFDQRPRRADRRTATGNRSAARGFTPLSGKVTAEFSARTSLTNQTVVAGRLSDASIQAVDLYFGNDGNIRVISGNTSLVVQPYQARKWTDSRSSQTPTPTGWTYTWTACTRSPEPPSTTT